MKLSQTSYDLLLRWIMVVFLLVNGLALSPAAMSTGIDWLAQQAKPDGSYQTAQDIAAPYQTTVEVLRTFYLLNQNTQPSIAEALNYIANSGEANASYLAQQLIVYTEQGVNSPSIQQKLLLLQNSAGGFGPLESYEQVLYDTAYALEALAVSNSAFNANTALQFLISRQQADGSWLHEGDNSASVALTAVIMRALWHYREQEGVAPALAQAEHYLLSQKTDQALWAETYVSALALIALDGYVNDPALISASIEALRSQQQAAGHWNNDVYATALALRALRLYDLRVGNVPPDLRSGAITGRIVRYDNSAAIAGARVGLVDLAGVEAVSGADGSFRLSGIPAKSYTLVVAAAGYDNLVQIVTVSAAQVVDVGNLALGAPQTLTLMGQVINGVTSVGVAGVQITSTTGEQLATDGNGQFTLSGLQTLTVGLHLEAAGYAPQDVQLTVSGWGTYQQVIQLSPLGSGGSSSQLSGQIIREDNQQPIAGAEVTLLGTGLSTLTDNNGHYQLDGIEELSLTVQVELAGYVTVTGSIQLADHGTFERNFSLRALDLNAYQILSVKAEQASYPGLSQARFQVSVANLLAESQTALIIAEVQDSQGQKVAQTIPYGEGTETPQAEFGFAANEIKQVTIPWETLQFAVGTYTLLVRVVVPGTISQSNPYGQILAENRGTVTLAPSKRIAGALSVMPPITQAGTNSPVSLTTELINKSNVSLVAPSYHLEIRAATTQAVVYETTLVGSNLAIKGRASLDFGTWVPTEAGNFNVTVKASDAEVQGEISGQFYVGNQASGQWQVTPQQVLEGPAAIQSRLHLEGVDESTATHADPLVALVREAIRTGGAYVAREAVNWDKSNKCFGCHIQSQSYFGLASALNKAPIDETALTSLYTSFSETIATAPTSRSSMEESALSLWALDAFPNKEKTFGDRYRAASYLYQIRQAGANGVIYWNSLGSGWWASQAASTSLAVQALSSVLETAYQSSSLNQMKELQFAVIPSTIHTGWLAMDLEQGPDQTLYGLMGVDSTGAVCRINPITGAMTQFVVLPRALGIYTGFYYGLTVAEDGTVYASGDDTIVKIAPNQAPQILTSGGMGEVKEIEINNQFLYATDYTKNAIYRIDLTGHRETIAQGGIIKNPIGLAFNNGKLLVANSGNLKILLINPDNGDVSVFADGLRHSPGRIEKIPNTDSWFVSDWPNIGANNLSRLSSFGGVDHFITMSASIYGLVFFDEQWLGGGYASYNAASGAKALHRLSEVPLNLDQISNYQATLEGGVRYLLANYKSTTDAMQRAAYLRGIGRAKTVITDGGLLSQIAVAMGELGTALRAQQGSDGSWGNNSMVTALVGMALETTDPSPQDPMIRKAVEYLLAKQQADDTWLSGGIFTTKLASTSLVIAYLPLALERLGGMDVDLHLVTPNNITLTNPSITATAVTPEAAGTHYYWQFRGITGQGRDLDFELMLQEMLPNEQRPVAVDAYLEFSNSFTGEVMRSPLEIPVVTAQGVLNVTASTLEKTEYHANEPVKISSQITNLTDQPQQGQLEVEIRAQGSTTALYTFPVSVIDIAPNGQQTTELSWETATQVTGEYEIVQRLYNADHLLISTTVLPFSIVKDTAVLTLQVSTDQAVYPAWATVTIDSRLLNTAQNAAHPGGSAQLEIVSPSGAILHQAQWNVPNLAANSQHRTATPYSLVDAANGSYQVNLKVTDSNNQPAGQASTRFAVERGSVPGISGQVRVQAATLEVGTPQQCTFILSNASQLAASGLEVEHSVVAVDTTSLVTSRNRSRDVAGQSTDVDSWSLETTGYLPGQYACVLQLKVDGIWTKLAHAAFTLTEPEIKQQVDAVWNYGQGCSLVLLDPDQPAGHEDDDEDNEDDHSCDDQDDPRDRTGDRDDDHHQCDDQDGHKDDGHKDDGHKDNGQKSHQKSGQANQRTQNSSDKDHDDDHDKDDDDGHHDDDGHDDDDDHDNDPERNSPSLADKQALLRSLGVDLTCSKIVTTDSDFTQALYSGQYTAYALLDNKVKLAETTQQAVRERVYLGEGLLMAGNHDERNHGIDAALGFDYKGHSQDYSGLQVQSSALWPVTETLDWVYADKIQKIQPTTAEPVGYFMQDLAISTQAAMTLNHYGQGQADYIGFDILSQATTAGIGHPFGNLLVNGLEHIQPDAMELRAGQVIAIGLTVTATVGDSQGRVVITVPTAQVTAVGNTQILDAQSLQADFNLTAGQTHRVTFWLKLQAPQTLQAEVQVLRNGQYQADTPLTLTLPVKGTVTIDTLLSELKTLNKQKDGPVDYSQVQKTLEKAKVEIKKANGSKALDYLLKATDQCLGGQRAETQRIRLGLDQLLRQVQLQLVP